MKFSVFGTLNEWHNPPTTEAELDLNLAFCSQHLESIRINQTPSLLHIFPQTLGE